MDFWQRYRAIDARDPRFDGQFVTAVSSTGIYCRPSCPARTPRPSNVRFYRTSAAAHEAGYRACKRCLPEAVPGDPEWNLRSDVAARAMRLIADGEVDRSGVSGLAARLGYSVRHVNRILRAELGAGALALARAQRAQTARTLLTSSSLTFAAVAFAAGFGSIRQFNETIHQVFDLTPGQVRKSSRGRDHGPDTAVDRSGGGMIRLSLSMPLRLPYDGGIFPFLAERAVSGVELCTDTSYERLLLLPAGPAWFRASMAESDGDGRGALPVTVQVSGLADLPALLARIRRLFDLDADPTAIDTALTRNPALSKLVTAVPGIRLPGSLDPHETLLRALAGESMTLAVGTESLEQLASAGPMLEVAGTTLTRAFPSASQLAAASIPRPADPGLSSATLRTVAERLADGSLDVGVGSDPATLRASLLALDDVEPWTADCVAMRILGQPDVELPLRGGTHPGHDARPSVMGTDSPAAATALDAGMEAVRPWRSYASMHLRRTGAVAAEPPSTRPRAARESHRMRTPPPLDVERIDQR